MGSVHGLPLNDSGLPLSSLPTRRDRYLLCYNAIVKKQAIYLRSQITLKNRAACFVLGAILGVSAGVPLRVSFGSLGSVVISVALAAASSCLFALKGPLFINERFPSKTLQEGLDAISNQELLNFVGNDPRLKSLIIQISEGQFAFDGRFARVVNEIIKVLSQDQQELDAFLEEKLSRNIGVFLVSLFYHKDRIREKIFDKIKELCKRHGLDENKEHEARLAALLGGFDPDQFEKRLLRILLIGEGMVDEDKVKTIFNRVLEQIRSNPGGRIQRLFMALFLEKTKPGHSLNPSDRIRERDFLALIEFMLDNHPVIEFILDAAQQGGKGELVGECFRDRLIRVEMLLWKNRVMDRDACAEAVSLLLRRALREESEAILFFSDDQALGNIQNIQAILNESSL